MSKLNKPGRLAAALAAVAAVLAAAPARADTLRQADVVVSDLDGEKVGCELTFVLAPGQGPGGKDLEADLGVLTRNDFWIAAVKIQSRGSDRANRPLKTISLTDGDSDNAAEFVNGLDADDEFSQVFGFNGPATARLYGGLFRTGSITLNLSRTDGSRESWTLDLTSRPDIRQAWEDCLKIYPSLPPEMSGGPNSQ